ncbi:MAG: putative DNA modification/repair radical SAM protein [Deltaproteobacteria bacterium]|jgi:predicted DNA-binding helix-hairpin-helix protein|nr:putative DNA modification/repair radical SAM protein [Deltaproteobacteria bacterium]
MNEGTLKKLKILAESAKYDVSCSSSGVGRRNIPGGIGSAESWGCCHSFTEDGRCISLLKVLLSNYCIYDCAYCVNRANNDIPRTAFSVSELVDLTIAFYRRNYIEGLFLSSAVLKSPDHTMDMMLKVLRELRLTQRFNGYIHMKCIPGASQELVRQAGLYADRLSVNIEIPSEGNLKRLAPDKDYQSVYLPMRHIQQGILQSREESRRFRHTPRFAPAGQSTQMIIGASPDRDREILLLSSLLYKGPGLKRVYYSGFVPVNGYDSRLPAASPAAFAAPVASNTPGASGLPGSSVSPVQPIKPIKLVPKVREHRLYQADWLMRFYHFEAEEILDESSPDLDLEVDPKIAWALRHPEFFPLDVNTADYAVILRVPGIGLKSAQRIIAARRFRKLSADTLRQLGVVLSRARFFLADSCALPAGGAAHGRSFTIQEAGPAYVRAALLDKKTRQSRAVPAMRQLSLFDSIH